MRTSVQRRCALNTLLTTAITNAFINEAHSELLESFDWSRKRDEIIILTTAQDSTGTWTVTNGSATATATASVGLGSGDVGKYIRFATDDALYVIGAVSGNDATLRDFNGTNVNYGGTTSTSATYVMFQRWYNLGTAIESIDVISYKEKLGEVTTDNLDQADPVRSTTGDPSHYSLGPRDSSDRTQIEFWPRPTGTIAIRANVILGHTDLSADADNPIVPSVVVVWKAAILSCYFLHSKDEDERWLKLANQYEKEFERAWERIKTMDESKFGLPKYIKDVGGSFRSDSDYGLDKDVG